MLFEVIALFLQAFPTNIANVAFVLLIVLETVSLLSQWTESIQHQTTDDITEKHLEECEINHIVNKTKNLKGLHSLANDTG